MTGRPVRPPLRAPPESSFVYSSYAECRPYAFLEKGAGSLSFNPASQDSGEGAPSRSVLDYITTAENLQNSSICTPYGGQRGLLVINPLQDLHQLSSKSTLDHLRQDGDGFVDGWEQCQRGGTNQQRLLICYGGKSKNSSDDFLPEKHPIAAGELSVLFKRLKLAARFVRCFWMPREILGHRESSYRHADQEEEETSNTKAIDVWYTIPVSVTINSNRNLSTYSSAIYSRFIPRDDPLLPHFSLVVIVLRYNWGGSDLDDEIWDSFVKVLDEYMHGPPSGSGLQGAKDTSSSEWHLAPQVAYFAAILKLWRGGLEQLEALTQKQEELIYEDLTTNTSQIPVSIRSIHHRLKFLYEEITNLQSICSTIESLRHIWSDNIESRQTPPRFTGVGPINDLEVLCVEFKWQIRSREQLVSRLNSLQNLYFNLASSRIAVATRSDSIAMKTIAIVTAIFLPATFIATFLSTTFFEFQPGLISVSRSIWIYFAVTIPVSLFILGGMWFWLRRPLFRSKVDEETGDSGVNEERSKKKMA